MSASASFVLFPLGDRRFAFHAEEVAELALPGNLQEFPHTTPLLTGVLVRRGRIVPVCDIAPLLVGKGAPARRFYLMTYASASAKDWTAVPVTGECELAVCEQVQSANGSPEYVTATIARGDERISVIDLKKLIAREVD